MQRHLPLLVLVLSLGIAVSSPAKQKQDKQQQDKQQPDKQQPDKQQQDKQPQHKQPPAKQSAPSAQGVQYLDMVDKSHPQPKLPYGRSFTISGKASQVCAIGTPQRDATKSDQLDSQNPCGEKGKKLTDLLAPTNVAGAYVVDGKDTPFTPSDISGDAWSLTVGKLDENTAVTFKLTFSGNLSPAQASAAVDQLMANKDYSANLETFFNAAFANPTQTTVLASAFGQTTAAIVLDVLKKQGVSPKNPDDLGKRLFIPTASVFAAFNLPAELKSLRDYVDPGDKNENAANAAKAAKASGITKDMAPNELYAKLTEALKSGGLAPAAPKDALLNDLATKAQTFVNDYAALGKQLAVDMTVNLTVAVGANADDTTEDLQKYAGFDAGALYVPRLHELRSFATVNIYFKAVSLHPAAGVRNQFWERTSLTFGMALHDLSGVDTTTTKIKGENAFIYGVGVRLNKYFRLTTGGVVYRTQLPATNGIASPLNNKLRHEFFIGPSIDISAVPALQKIFAKGKSD